MTSVDNQNVPIYPGLTTFSKAGEAAEPVPRYWERLAGLTEMQDIETWMLEHSAGGVYGEEA